MYLGSKQDLSVLRWTTELFADTSFVKVVEEFTKEGFVIPCIAVENDVLEADNYELGNRKFQAIRSWYLDIYATSRSQRDEFSYRILEALENKINVYDFDEGFVTPTKIGILDPDDVQIRVIKVLPELTEDMYYRAVVSFTTVYEDI